MEWLGGNANLRRPGPGHKDRASILCFYTRRPAAEVRTVFERARLGASVREGHVRLSIALFNTADDIGRALQVTRQLV